MNISIREHIINNFKGVSADEIQESIVSSVKDKDEITLPGLGVFFEILWDGSSEDLKKEIINILKNNLN